MCIRDRFNAIPNKIESNLPVAVTQYFTTQNCNGNASPYEPDMIVLNPVEQNISNVTLISSNLTVAGTHQHKIHVILKNEGTALSSFRFDNSSVNSTLWQTHPEDASYSYLYLSVSETSHTLLCDSGFNALAYGYGNAETYGYSAGTYIKDLYPVSYTHLDVYKRQPLPRLDWFGGRIQREVEEALPLSRKPLK